MKLKIFHIDAFTNQLFKGNPAAVIPLESWLSKDLMQKIAFENNLSETAFFVNEGETPSGMILGLGSVVPNEVYKVKDDFMAVLDSEKEVQNLQPDFAILKKIDARGIIVTAKGNNVDFVSRFFAPQSGLDEDPVTGSSHTKLIPYWTEILGKNEMTAKQLSERGGDLICKLIGDRVEISGQAKLYMSGEIEIED